jgi:hypothetical protein
MNRVTGHPRTARAGRVAVTCAYADPAGEIERARARLRLRVTPFRQGPHAGAAIAPFVVVELDEPPAADHRRTAARVRAVAADPAALRAFTRKVLP